MTASDSSSTRAFWGILLQKQKKQSKVEDYSNIKQARRGEECRDGGHRGHCFDTV